MANVLITGANRGIGLALASEFLKEGDSVIAAARDPDKAGELRELEKSADGRLAVHRLDVADADSVKAVTEALTPGPGSLDILINNAGVFPEEGNETLEELDLALFDTAFATNVTGTARVCQALLPLLRKGDNPRIVNISSGAGSITDKTDSRHYCYSCSKAALNQFSRALAAELKPEGIVVAPITPGWVKTDMGGPKAELTVEESAASLVRTIRKLGMKQTGLFLDRHGRSGVYRW